MVADGGYASRITHTFYAFARPRCRREPRRPALRTRVPDSGEEGWPTCGLTPGCPAATDWLVLLMAPWIFRARRVSGEVKARAYVDDLTAWCRGGGSVSAVQALVGLTEELGRDAGLEVNKAKSRRFGVPESIAAGLAVEEGPPPGGGVAAGAPRRGWAHRAACRVVCVAQPRPC